MNNRNLIVLAVLGVVFSNSALGQVVLPEVPPTQAVLPECPVFYRSLYRGLSDNSAEGEVTKLQKFLAEDSEVYPEKLVTGYFGLLTEKAVQRWQVKQNVVSSGTPETNGYGVVGPKTRAAIRICPPVVPPPTLKSPITVISPNGGEVFVEGTKQTIRWNTSGPYRQVVPTTKLNVRSSASLSAEKVGVVSSTDVGVVTGDAITSGGYVWWPIKYESGVVGWSVSDWLRPTPTVNINLLTYNEPCIEGRPCLLFLPTPYTIAKSVPDVGAYDWAVPRNLEGKEIPDGKYMMVIQRTTMGESDQSDKPFEIVSEKNTPIAIKTESNLQGTVGKEFSANFVASGGETPYSWSIASGDLPPGLKFVPAPVIQIYPTPHPKNILLQGKPESAGTYKFILTVSDANGNTGTTVFTSVILGIQNTIITPLY